MATVTDRQIPQDPLDFANNINESVMEITPAMMRLYFIFLFILVIVVVVALTRKVSSLEDLDLQISLRGELLCNLVLFCAVYACSWLPILFLGIIDGELETASVSEGFKGQVANTHCALQDLMVRSFCMIIVVSSVIYLRYSNDKVSYGCCHGRPNMFLFGVLMPVVVTEATRFLMYRKEWLMPTQSIIHHLGPIRFAIRRTPVFCVQQIDEAWLRHVVAEWMETIMMVVAIAYCFLPCFRHCGKDSDSEEDPKPSSESRTDSPSNDSPELQMESLIQIDSEPLENSPSKEASPLEPSLAKTNSNKSTGNSKGETEAEGLFAKGNGFLESIIFIGILWSVVVRPFMAITLYALNDGTFSNYLDIPTHVLLIIATATLPLEFELKWAKAEEDNDTFKSDKDQDVMPLWKTEDEENSNISHPDSASDVGPLWLREGGHTESHLYAKDAVSDGLPKGDAITR